MESHVCVLQTAIELQQAGYQVFVVEDAVCSRHKQHHQNALARLRRAEIIITNVESVIFEWLRDASHPDFKALSRLLR
jgi:nicotinamidase-related amidase